MKINLKLTKRMVFLFAATAFCALAVVGCSTKTGAEGKQENGSGADSDYEAVSLEETEENQGNGNSVDDGYEVVYSEELEAKEGKIQFEISLSLTALTEGTIKIDGQEIPIDPELAEIGYIHPEVKVYDFTDDGKEEIALIISGGTSGAVQGIQVFGNNDGTWEEIGIPSEIYDDSPGFLKEQLAELDIKLDGSKSVVFYRTFSLDNENILIDYQFFEDSGSTFVGTIQKKLYYSSDKKEFVLGDV